MSVDIQELKWLAELEAEIAAVVYSEEYQDAISPSCILSLIAEIESLRRQREEAKAKLDAVTAKNDCIEWDGYLINGYAYKKIDYRHVRVSRLIYAQKHGLSLKDINGLVIRHKCDNKKCVNPDHLEIGTQTDNMRDMKKRGRGWYPPSTNNAKLSLDDVAQIRALLAEGKTQKHIAEMFGVHRRTIGSIALGDSWNPDFIGNKKQAEGKGDQHG